MIAAFVCFDDIIQQQFIEWNMHQTWETVRGSLSLKNKDKNVVNITKW